MLGREKVHAKQSGHHDLSTVAQIVGPDDLGLQVKNVVVCHRREITCFDSHAVVHLPRNRKYAAPVRFGAIRYDQIRHRSINPAQMFRLDRS